MRRRSFLAAAAASLAASRTLAQPENRSRRIAVLEYGTKEGRAANWRIFEARLAELGYVEGKNVVFERRWADADDARMPTLAQELLASRPEVVVVNSTPGTQALMRITSTLPIITVGTADPVATGLVASLARPGGNVTGFSGQLTDVNEKRLALLHEILPQAKRFALLGPDNAAVQLVLKRMQAVARSFGAEVRLLEASDARTIERAFEHLRSEPVDALLVASALVSHNRQIVALAAKFKVPDSYIQRDMLDAGALLVFGPDSGAYYRRAAEYVHRVLSGTKPADLPVEQPKAFWIGVNLKTARNLGVTVPKAVLLAADRVIE